MPEAINPDVLARYLAGTGSQEEARRVRAWLEADPQARLALEGLAPLPPRDAAARRDPEAFLARLANREAEHTMQPSRARPPAANRPAIRRLRRLVPSTPLRPAVAVGLLALVGLLAYAVLRLANPDAAFRTYATAPGQRTTITLASGSTVELNAASHLRVPEAFTSGPRTVQLEGEAFFDVAPDAARPFVVHAGEAVVQVLGTAFNVASYADVEGVTVTVAEGHVALRAAARRDTAGVVLTAGQQGRLATPPGQPPRLTVASVDLAPVLAWREGRLVFQGTPLPEVARALERRYGVTVVLADEALASRRLDATFHAEPVEAVLATLAAALQIHYRIDGQRVTLAAP